MAWKSGHVCGNSIEGMHDEQRAGAGGDGLFDGLGREVERHRVDLRKDRSGADLEHGVGHGDECERRHDDLVAFTNTQGEQCEMKPCCAGAYGYGMRHGVVRGQLGFKG